MVILTVFPYHYQSVLNKVVIVGFLHLRENYAILKHIFLYFFLRERTNYSYAFAQLEHIRKFFLLESP